jgi:cytochrome c553
MMVMTLPWHWLGLNGQWRRVAHFDYDDPLIAWWGDWVDVSLLGGIMLLVSAVLFIRNLAILHGRQKTVEATAEPMRYSLPLHPVARLPAALNGFALWNVLVLVLMAAAYGWPIGQFHRAAIASCDRPPRRSPGLSRDGPEWRLWGTLFVLAALAVGGLLGLIVMPVVQGRAAGIDAYTAICRAVGILPGSPARPTPPYQAEPQPVTKVAWTAATFEALYGANRADGARLAEERCLSCHTLEGNTPDPTIPRNISQSVFALYKQLHDFRSGARVSEVMSPLAKDLDDKQIVDLAAYYGRLFRGAIHPAESAPVGRSRPRP